MQSNSNLRFLIFTVLLLYNVNLGHGLTTESLDEVFKADLCIAGNIKVSESGNAFIETGSSVVKNTKEKVPTSTTTETHLLVDLKTSVETNKNVLAHLNEVAQFNNVSTKFSLEKEEGLSHEKVFFIRLDFGEETYFASATSIKNAQYAAAHKALKFTKLMKPDKSLSPQKAIEKLTPSVQLNNIAAKLGMKVQYINEFGEMIDENDLMEADHTTHNYYSLDQSSKSYISKLNDSIKQSKTTVKVKTEEAQEQSPFRVRVVVGDKTFLGTGVTIQAARHDAATKALENFKKMSLKDAEQCLERGEECNKLATKSPISLVFEIAAVRGHTTVFEVIGESGPDHKKEFVMSCRVGDLLTQGEGPSKKVSKRKAAEKMVEELNRVEPISAGSTIRVNTNKNKKKKNKNKVARGALNNVKNNLIDAVSSVLTVFGGNEGISDDISDDSVEDSSTKKFKTELLQLGKDIGINMDFLTFSNDENHSTIISLQTDPSYVCYGKDVTSQLAEENASLNAIKFIKQVGLDNIIIPLTNKKHDLPKIIIDTKRLRLQEIEKE